MSLPRFVTLKSANNGKHFTSIKKDEESAGHIKFSEHDDVAHATMFVMEPAKCEEGLVHIKCSVTKKYLAMGNESNMIIAGPDTAEEDKSKPECTLFEPIYQDSTDKEKTVRFRHVHTQTNVWSANKEDKSNESCLFVGPQASQVCDLLRMTDWDMKPMTELFPRYVAFRANYNKKYVQYENQDRAFYGLLRFNGEQLMPLYGKYEVRLASVGNGLVHIKCCYNNKYWARRSEEESWISAIANEPEEDQSKWSCTLLEPFSMVYEGEVIVQFRHVQLNKFLNGRAPDYAQQLEVCLCANDDYSYYLSTFKVIDCEGDRDSLSALPKQIAFKGKNGRYLCVDEYDKRPFLRFTSDDIADPRIPMEIITGSDGYINIKSCCNGYYWTLESPMTYERWLTAGASYDNRGVFWPVRLDENRIAVRYTSTGQFCIPLSTSYLTDGFRPYLAQISDSSLLTMEETILSRKIYNIEYDLPNARIYNKTILTMATGIALNLTEEQDTVQIKFSYTKTQTTKWSGSTTKKMGIQGSMETNIATIVGESIEVSTEVSHEYNWEDTYSSSQNLTTDHTVTVPPMTKLKVSLLLMTASCDIPFSYNEKITHLNGDTDIQTLCDGIYKGANSYDLKFDVTKLPL